MKPLQMIRLPSLVPFTTHLSVLSLLEGIYSDV